MFSGLKSRTNARSANMRRFPANASIRATASSWVIVNGRTASGTAPLGICSLTVSTWRHQWQRAPICSSVLTTTSAPHPAHFIVISDPAPVSMSEAPEPMVVPRSVVRSPLSIVSSRRASDHSWRQNRQMSMPADGRSWISVDPHMGQRLTPSSSRSFRVSMIGSDGGSIRASGRSVLGRPGLEAAGSSWQCPFAQRPSTLFFAAS